MSVSRGRVADFLFQPLDLLDQAFMLLELSLQEALGDSCLGRNAGRGQLVQVAVLGLALAEIAGFDPSPLDQRPQAVVGLAEADAELSRKVALTEIRLGFQGAEDGQAGFEVQEIVSGDSRRFRIGVRDDASRGIQEQGKRIKEQGLRTWLCLSLGLEP
jgi:hypothetical protein